ncbi:peptide ABC transporter substrate-binding protein [Oscillochloris sp. ZM17-4]|uniref:peptide ABC transporter substrate-binding protein n=1 Tax=Oscillochloris sp. ZM17-4 TaxID=2866714 RepID=UPI001C73D23B|nr:peptide ABC transporter substrate-binding protein [Oscillochloris sp. ZM17-4]MBX0329977.1 peptide ABC transporter substrate-binding protein [Oscillochloris sp. ZM17-4]
MNLRRPAFIIHHSIFIILILLLAACGTSRPVPTPTNFISAGMTATPTNFGNGGTLIMALGARDPNTLDPALAGDVGSAFIIRQLFSGLTRLNSRLEVQPDLAASWVVSPDGLTYTFSLRMDARFADGAPITSDDVIYSLERASDPGLAKFLPAATYLGDIVGVREKIAGKASSISGLSAPDAHTVVMQIDSPKSYFLAKLSHVTSFVVDRRAVEADGRGDWTERPNGSGPFAIERWDHDQLLVLKRNLNFYRDIPKLDRVRFLMGAAASNPMQLYEQGDIDVTDVPTYALARVEDTSSALSKELLRVPQLSIYYMGLNVSLPPFDDPKVRQAFALLIDRAKVAEVTLDGAAEAARGILPPGMPGYDPQLPQAESDIARAKALLAESRYGGADKLPPIAAYGSWAGTLAEVAKDELGITIEVRGYEDYGDFLAALDANTFQIYGSGWIADYPDPENFLDVLFRGGSGENHTSYDSPQVNDLLSRAAVEKDEAARFDLYHQAERQILADAPVIPIYHDIAYTLVKPYVRGLEVTPMGILDLSTVELAR